MSDPLSSKVAARFRTAHPPGKTTRPPPGKFQPRVKLPSDEEPVDITEVTAGLEKDAVIRKEKGEFCVRSPNNPSWNGGCYKSEGEAKKRLEQVEYFKKKKANLTSESSQWIVDKLTEFGRSMGGHVDSKPTSVTIHLNGKPWPAVKKLVFMVADQGPMWIETMSGVKGWGWDTYRGTDPKEEAMVIKWARIAAGSEVERSQNLDYIFRNIQIGCSKVSDAGSSEVTGIVDRPDLAPRQRGWSTNPNTYGKPTYYQVLGTGLTEDSMRLVMGWLTTHKKHLTPGHHSGAMGSYTDVEVSWDDREKAWIIVSRYTYTGG